MAMRATFDGAWPRLNRGAASMPMAPAKRTLRRVITVHLVDERSSAIVRLQGELSAANDRLLLADTVEKLLFRSHSKNCSPADALLVLGRGGPCNFLLRATRTVLTNAATIRGVNCRLQCAVTRIRGERNLEFFNRIGPTAAIRTAREQPFNGTTWACFVEYPDR